jgi:HD-GYP domain-containing protein (c-di-GMP phosphodiesterase class II)
LNERNSPRADVLGKLLLIQETLDVIPSEAQIAAFLRRALRDVPGVADTHLAVGGALVPQAPQPEGACPVCASIERGEAAGPDALARLPGVQELALRTARKAFGALYVAIADRASFAPYVDFVRNIANVLAANLETRAHVARLGEVAGDLERKIATRTAALEESLEQTIAAVAALVEIRDPYTAGHQRRVAALAGAIAVAMSLPEVVVKGIRLAATIHDIGKIYVPAEILSRPGGLSPLELRFIRTHPQIGHDIMKDVRFPWPIATMILEHHERLDGSGYPSGLAGDAILLGSRIIAVADVVEAMASHRPYRPALGIDAALAEITGHAGRLFDPHVVRTCVQLFREEGLVLGAPQHPAMI